MLDIPGPQQQPSVVSRRIRFSREQIEFINKQFPEQVLSANATAEQLRWNAAIRFVVHTIGTWIEQPGDSR